MEKYTFDNNLMGTLKTLLFTALWLWASSAVAQTANAMGDAVAEDDECYTVTLPIEWQNGAVWFLETIDLGEPFTIDLKLNFGFIDANGADGVVFVMQTSGTTLLGEPGGGLGFGGISPSFGVEFDTFQNTDFDDIWQDHIAMVSDGSVLHSSATNLAGPITALASGANIEDGNDHLFRLVWNPDADVVEVYFDCELRLTHSIDLVEDIFSGTTEVYWGFTGSTGGLFNTQTVCLDQFTLGLPDDVALCEGESIQLGVNGPEDGFYTWSPVDGVSDPTVQDPVFTPEITTTYTVEYTDACGEVQVDDVEIAITEISVNIGPDQAICDGESAVFTADATDGATLTWGNGSTEETFETEVPGGVEVVATLDGCQNFDAANVTLADLPEPDVWETEVLFCEGESIVLDASCAGCTYNWGGSVDGQWEVDATGTYTVEVTSDEGCIAEFSVDVDMTVVPAISLPASVGLCDGESAVLDPGPGETYNWSTGATSSNITVSEAGEYEVTVSNGPCAAEAMSTVMVMDLPQWNGLTLYPFCDGETVLLTQDVSNMITDFGDGATFLEVNTAGVYEVTLTDELSGCINVVGLQVEELPVPTIEVPATASFCEGTVGSLFATVTPEDTPVSWDTGDVGQLIQFQGGGTYTAMAENDCGTAEASSDVGVKPCTCDAWVPNAFTPDNDGTNDTFFPVLECIPDTYVFRVFDRWGAVIFESTEVGESWLGNVDGGAHYVHPGLYAWQVVYEHRISGDTVVTDLQGTVAVVR